MLKRDDFLSDIYLIEWMKHEGKLDTESIDKDLESNFDRLDFEVPSTEFKTIKYLLDRGCYISSSKVTYAYNNTIPTVTADPRLDLATKEDTQELSRLAAETFTLDKYRNDPYLDAKLVPKLYSEWIKNSLNGRSDKVIVYREAAILGFTNTIKKTEELYIDLVGVRKNCEGRGIGGSLISKVKELYPQETLSCTTQIHNIPMQRVLQRAGFGIVSSSYIFTAVR